MTELDDLRALRRLSQQQGADIPVSQRQRLVRIGLLYDVNEPFALTEAGRIALRDEGASE